MSQTHWKKLNNPDYLGAYALDPGKDLIATIKSVAKEKVVGADGKKEECIVMRFAENIKPMILNSTNAKTIQKLYKTPYIEEWSGRKIQIFVDQVKAFGDVVEALRIRPFVPKADKVETKCGECSAKIEPFGNTSAEQMAAYTYQKYGKPLCAVCAKKNSEAGKVVDVL